MPRESGASSNPRRIRWLLDRPLSRAMTLLRESSIGSEARGLVDDRLIDELPEPRPVVGPQDAARLDHEDRYQLLLRVDPELRAGIAAPVEVPGGSRNRCDAVRRPHRKP